MNITSQIKQLKNRMLNKILPRFRLMLNARVYLNRKINSMPFKTKAISLMIANFTIFNILIIATSKQVQMKEQTYKTTNRQPAQAHDQQCEQQFKEELFQIPDDIKAKVNKHKMILVMDLDQTMVFTRRKRKPGHYNYRQLEVNVPHMQITKDSDKKDIIYVEFRPHIGQFLEAVSQLFTIYVYTAGTKNYADMVLDCLPNKHVIAKRFYRDSCITHRGNLIKDLKIIRKTFGPHYKDKLLILVDDNGLSINYNHPHSIKVRAFVGCQDDRYLTEIFEKLIDYYRKYSHTGPTKQHK